MARIHFVAFITSVLTLSLTTLGIHGYEHGAPKDRCVDMRPSHYGATFYDCRNADIIPPIRITTDKTTYSPGEPIRVLVMSETEQGPMFLGLMLQARDSATLYTRQGKFSTPATDSNLQLRDCDDVVGTAVTHTKRLNVASLNVTWTYEDDGGSVSKGEQPSNAGRDDATTHMPGDDVTKANDDVTDAGSSSAGGHDRNVTFIATIAMTYSSVYMWVASAPISFVPPSPSLSNTTEHDLGGQDGNTTMETTTGAGGGCVGIHGSLALSVAVFLPLLAMCMGGTR